MAGHHPHSRRRGAPSARGAARAQSLARPGPQGDLTTDPGRDDQDEASWFAKPWRDGRNAVRLLETLGILAGGHALPEALQLTLARPADQTTAADYAACEAAGIEAGLTPGPDGIVHPAAASCLCNWIAKSHGGGVVPNVYLRMVTGALLWRGLAIDAVRWEAGRARARDLGLDDARSAEFTRLWYARRYAAAWQLGQ